MKAMKPAIIIPMPQPCVLDLRLPAAGRKCAMPYMTPPSMNISSASMPITDFTVLITEQRALVISLPLVCAIRS